MRNSTAEPEGTLSDAARFCHAAAMASLWHHRDQGGRLARSFARWQAYRPGEGSPEGVRAAAAAQDTGWVADLS